MDRSTISYAVDGDKKSKIFNIMFALGARSCSAGLRAEHGREAI